MRMSAPWLAIAILGRTVVGGMVGGLKGPGHAGATGTGKTVHTHTHTRTEKEKTKSTTIIFIMGRNFSNRFFSLAAVRCVCVEK